MVPAGLAWRAFVAKHDRPQLYDRDQIHPSLAGSYFAACVFLSALLNGNPVGMRSQALDSTNQIGHLAAQLESNAGWGAY